MSETPEDMLRRVVDDRPPDGDESLMGAFAQRYNRSRNLAAIAAVAQLVVSIAGMILGMWLLVQSDDLRMSLLALFVMLVGFETSILVKLWYWISVTRISLAKETKRMQLMVARSLPDDVSEKEIGSGERPSIAKDVPGSSFLMRANPRVLNWTLRITMVLATICLMLAYGKGGGLIAQRGLGASSVADIEQSDEWTFGASESVSVLSRLDVKYLSTPTLRLTLPYAAGVLESVTVNGRPAPVNKLNWREYEAEIPTLPFKYDGMIMEVAWHFPVPMLYEDDASVGGLRTQLRPLVPVLDYELNVILQPDSPFEPTDPSYTSPWRPFSWRSTRPDATLGACGLMLRRKDAA